LSETRTILVDIVGQRNDEAGCVHGWCGIQEYADVLLIQRIANGDKLAMHALFAKHRTQVYRWLLRFAGNEAQAEDILSEVFLDVWRQADRFEARSSVSTWILSIARFRAC
jgi:RNA polymerase sigma-70 factor, ECF subfamily